MDAVVRSLVIRGYIAAGILVVLVAAGLTIVAGSIVTLLALLAVELVLQGTGLGRIPGLALGAVMVLGTVVPACVAAVWTYRHLPRRFRDGPPSTTPSEAGQASDIRHTPSDEPTPTLAELDARLAPPGAPPHQ